MIDGVAGSSWNRGFLARTCRAGPDKV